VDIEQEPFRPIDPGGESWAAFLLRVGAALERITNEHAGKTIVVVTHGGVIDGSFVHFFGMPMQRVPPAGFATHNTAITHWERVPHRGRLRWRLAGYNDHAHLRDLGPSEWLRWDETPAAPASEAEEKPAVPLPTEERTA
jgi:probable phosphoglycerate mutase